MQFPLEKLFKGEANFNFPIWNISREIPGSWKIRLNCLVAVFHHYILYIGQQLDELVGWCKVVAFHINDARELLNYKCLTRE